MVAVVSVDHAPATAVASMKASIMSPPISVPGSALIPTVHSQLPVSSAPENPSTVSAHGVPMIVVTNYPSFIT